MRKLVEVYSQILFIIVFTFRPHETDIFGSQNTVVFFLKPGLRVNTVN